MFRVLRKKEFESILLDRFGKLPSVNDFIYYQECLNWIQKINIVGLQKKVMKCLKERTLLSVDDVFEERVPSELSFYVYFSKKNRLKYNKLDSFLNKKLEV